MSSPASHSFRQRLGLLLLVVGVTAALLSRRGDEARAPETAARSTDVRATDGPRVGAEVAPVAAEAAVRTEGFAERSLLAFGRPAEAAELDVALPAPASEVHYVRINKALVTGKQSPFWRAPGEGRFEVPLPGGAVATIVIEGAEMLGPDRFTSVGRIEGRPGSRALFAWNEGFLHAEIADPALGTFALRAATAEWAQFYRVAPERVPTCAGERVPNRAAAGTARVGAASASPPAVAAENPQRAEVHLMMVHTQAVLSTLAGDARAAALRSAFDLAVTRVNSILEASQVTARVKLVHIAETRYDENASGPAQVQDDALTAIQSENDGKMDEIHALRDRVGADVVCLALQRRDSASSGLSFLLGDLSDASDARYAFSVVQYSSVAGTTVVAHELGHIFGCAHDREHAVSGAGAYSYSYAHRFFGADGAQYRDIMSYPPGIELNYFSNPRVIAPAPVSVPMGVAAGLPGESDAAQTIERNAFATSAYRLQTQRAASPGTLLNVATRAQVGRGEEVLIGGFVVQGSQPKAVLIRAAGPALIPFGVTGALADPVLTVFGGATPLAWNDNWMTPGAVPAVATGAEIAAAAQRVRAFPFATGSEDAAVLVTLPPGAYTAVVEGARGTSGVGLVEAYEVEAGAARIVNLATRGFAGRDGREMVGGFVVGVLDGGTKRVLIRVLGPTLARAPFYLTATMDDPELELRNAAGELILKCDDWSSGAEGGASPANDFKPLVQYYDEKRIFATGLAPANRREPCVLVDLPPGNYTVIVRPFEERSLDPQRDQPARPGVGVVEVYEIAP